MGPFGVIPKPFRMESYSEAIPNGKPFLMERYFEWVAWVGLGWTERPFKQYLARVFGCEESWPSGPLIPQWPFDPSGGVV